MSSSDTSRQPIKRLPGGYVSVQDLWRFHPPEVGRTVITPDVPAVVDGRPVYVALIHGYRVGAELGMVDFPTEVRLTDARSGESLAGRNLPAVPAGVRAASLDAEALARLASATDALAPSFFGRESTVPADLVGVATKYRADFGRAIQPEFVALYKQQAPDWFQWVGL